MLAEAVRAGTAPAAIVLGEPDPIPALGAIVARELYGRAMPVAVITEPAVRSGDAVTLRASANTARIERS